MNKEDMAKLRKKNYKNFMEWCRKEKPIEKAFFKALLSQTNK